MMPEYISREAAIARLKRIVEVNRLRTDRAWFTPDGVEYLINEISAADVRPIVRGKWRFEKSDGKTCDDGWVCSACNCGFHTHVPYFEDFSFCPNCGADMREKRCSRGERRKADI